VALHVPVETIVRRVRPADAGALRDVRLAALLDAPSAFSSTHSIEAALTDDDWQERATHSASGDERVTFLAWADGRPIGIVGAGRPGGERQAVELVSMWTSPNHRRTGLGHALVHAVVEWARATEASEISLWVTRGNEAARRLYESFGFRMTSQQQPLESDPCLNELRMTLRLTND
jgi:GNAT superfamily N-acetyltransferase